ncbi:30S ribosomal protein S2 [Candidatus Daviesbacteria bacterium]|nr:30S ribosomal protein S2 [Candidatus Daviesbacteria bacterium]
MNAPTLQELLEAGVHFGHKVRRGNPKMLPFIYGVRGGVHIIDLEASEKMLRGAVEFAHTLGEEGKVILFVGTKKQAQPIVKELAEKVSAPYITSRWVGGLLTNFDEIKKNLNKLAGLKEQQEKGELGMYTKKEQLLISRKLQKFDVELGGIASLESIPDALFIVDAAAEKSAVNEANKTGVKIIGIADTNSNPALLDFPLPGNDDATKSIRIFTQAITQAYGEGKTIGGKKAAAKAKAEAKAKAQEEVKVPEGDVEQAEELVEKVSLEESERKV